MRYFVSTLVLLVCATLSVSAFAGDVSPGYDQAAMVMDAGPGFGPVSDIQTLEQADQSNVNVASETEPSLDVGGGSSGLKKGVETTVAQGEGHSHLPMPDV